MELPKDKFIIQGMGQAKLEGEFHVNGAKNFIMPLLASSILFSNKIKITLNPDIEDAKRFFQILEKIGASIKITEKYLEINTKNINSHIVDRKLGQTLRSSIILTGPILARLKKVEFPRPGGCVIGERPIDIYLNGFKKMGAKIKKYKNYYSITADKLKGAEFFLKTKSVTATETLMMAACLAEGQTILKNASMEPEIIALAEILNSSGAIISGAGSPEIKIKGRNNILLKSKNDFKTIPDRIEAGSIILLGASVSQSNIKVTNCNPLHLEALIEILKESGLKIKTGKNFIHLIKEKNQILKNLSIKTHEYPGFPTDLQSQMAVFFTQCSGQSKIFETIFEDRFKSLEGLKKMGAKIKILNQHQCLITGPTHKLKEKKLIAPDLRGGFAYIIAACLSDGQTEISNIYYIDRGYYQIEKRLKKLGIKIERQI